MKQNVSPTMVVIAIIVLIMIVAVIWKLTLGKSDDGGEIMPEGKAGQPDPAIPTEPTAGDTAPLPGGGSAVPGD